MRRGQDMKGLRDQNLSVLLSAIWENAPISRKELARLSGLAPSSITRLIRQLREHGLIKEDAKGESSGGRHPLLVSPNPDAGLIISLDLSGSHLRGGIFDAANNLVCASEKPFNGAGSKAIKNQLLNITHELYSHPKAQNKRFLGLGVSFPGVVQSGGIISKSFRLKLENFPLHQILSEEFNLPVYMEVDTAAAALAEKYYGAGRGTDNFIYILVSNGIGGSVIIDGQLARGKAGFGGMGHFIVDKDGPICPCGKRGCLEIVAAGPAILRDIRNILAFGRGDAIITEIVGEDLEDLTLDNVAEAALQGSSLAREAIENSARHLAYGISIIAVVLDIGTFIIGGEVPQYAGELYFNSIRHFLESYYEKHLNFDIIDIIPAELERDSFLQGISMLTLQEIFGIQR
jgi:N-acetylglucosamine repressor